MMKITPLGDMHNSRQTQLVQTENETYIKKPRNFNTEVAFSSFCQKMKELGFDTFSRSVTLLSEGDGYHTQRVEENLPADENGIASYYYNAGALLCFCYMFLSKDLHCENLIAAGDTPVIVDMETLLSGKLRSASAGYNLSRSVLCSHLLCNFFADKGIAQDVSGFTGIQGDMKNIPHINNKKVFLWERNKEFLSGFRKAYDFLLNNQQEVVKALRLFDSCHFRQILRPTETYHILSEKLKKLPKEKKEETARLLLSFAYERDIDPDRLNKARLILDEEVRCVVENEIPLFYTKGNSTDLYLRDSVVFSGYLEVSPVSYATQRLGEFSAEDLKRQEKIIELAVSASTPLQQAKNVNINQGALLPGEICAKMVANSEVDLLPGGFCMLEQRGSKEVNFVSSGFALYSGLCGIMCMLASMYRKTEKKEYLNILNRYLENFANIVLRDDSPITLTDSNASLGDGVTGMIGALLHINELTDISEFSVCADKLIQRLSIPQKKHNTDYLNGIGALPVILRKYNKTENEICKKLYESFLEPEFILTGTAHGTAGLVLSLCALKKSGFSIEDEKIKALINKENEYFHSDKCNWQDLRDPTQTGFMSGWCSGAPGIGMARKRMVEMGVPSDIQLLCEKDIALSKEFLSMETETKRDSLCCGTGARLMAGSYLGIKVDSLFEKLKTAEKENRLRFVHPADTNDVNVSLMQGLSGVAYALSMYGDPLCGGMLI